MLKRNKVRLYFFLKNLLRGIAFFAVAIIFYEIIFGFIDFEEPPIDISTTFVFILFFFSELIFGIIPPEVFLGWIIKSKSLEIYPYYVLFFACLSYCSGFLAFLFGKYSAKTWLYEIIKKYIIGKYERKIKAYGWLVIVVSAVTPLPYSATCAVIGAIGFGKRKFLFYSLARFIRYGVYGFGIWYFIG